eukprot:14927.XXX_1295411_1295584_1 [CDS] Oithona nana genome sequencing.
MSSLMSFAISIIDLTVSVLPFLQALIKGVHPLKSVALVLILLFLLFSNKNLTISVSP